MKKYQSIQYLRALAALMVVFHHARNPAPGLYNPLTSFGAGQAGVDIFFVISGFIMYSAARIERPIEFVRRRVIRVVPLYWLATLATLAFSISLDMSSHFVPGDVVRSLLFVPHYSPANPGQILPYLVPGWTLNFEMFFYVIFAIGLVTRRLIAVLVLTMLALVAAGFLRMSDNALWSTYTNPLLLEFLAGVLVARWSERSLDWPWALLLPTGFIATILSAPFDGPRVLLWGVPAVMMVTGAVALERNQMLPRWPFFGMIGDASYSIYLFQIIVLVCVQALVLKTRLSGPIQFMAMISLSLLAATALGLIVHFAVERPLTKGLSKRARIAPARAHASMFATDNLGE